ncbi:hypothetical protein O1L60_37195 [Streptomyces diastatochromogenes]|nr:hypothetical protein [Streptomyces diastatochromogenes]
MVVDTDHEVNRDRTLACLESALPGPAHQAIRSSITGLLSFDPAVRTTAADRLRTGTTVTAPRPARPRIDGDLLDEIIEHTTSFCVGEARAIVDPVQAARLNVPTSIDVYGGSSGLGLELLHHAHRPDVRSAVAALAQWTAEQSRNLSPGFYTGRTGVELFLTEAQAEAGTGTGTGTSTGPSTGTGTGTGPSTEAAPPSGHPVLPERALDGGPPEADLIAGAAGIGLGRLLLARHALRSGHRHAADRHLAVAADCDRMLASGAARLTPTGSDTAAAPHSARASRTARRASPASCWSTAPRPGTPRRSAVPRRPPRAWPP